MKHAYLIIAHNEFEHLQTLIRAIDDVRNDIFVHIDKKVKTSPKLSTEKSNLIILKKRMNVIYGDVSQIKTECLLLQTAYNYGSYKYYHILSGVHFPLKSQNEIHDFFEKCNGASVLIPMDWSSEDVNFKLGRYHFFLKNLLHPNKIIFNIYHILWRIPLFLQKKFKIKRNITFSIKKTANWCSLTDEAVSCILNSQENIIKRFRYTFCADEYYKMAILSTKNIPLLFSDKLLFTKFNGAAPETLHDADFDVIMGSNCLFARKFSKKHHNIVDLINQTFKP